MSSKEILKVENISVDFDKIRKVHFIGIGGISMSSLAEILLSMGISVSGSDTNCSELTKHLESIGATINYVQEAANITDDIDLTVYTAAIDVNDPELCASINKNIPTIPRPNVFPKTIDLGEVEVTRVSIIFDVFSVVIDVDI